MSENNWAMIIEYKIKESKRRDVKKRGWIKLDKGWLTSSINYRMELSEQAVFSKLLVMADEFGPVPGLISDNDFRPMPHEYLAHQSNSPLEIFEETLKKGINDDSIFENSHGIFLTHFDDYQFTEYDRQKPSRQARKEKKAYGVFKNVLLSASDYKKLVEKFGEDGTLKRIETLSTGIESKGYRYKSHYAAILVWERSDEKKLGKTGKHDHMVQR